MKLVSIVIPAYNEQDCIPELVRRLKLVFDSEKNFDFEAVIVENGSEDNSWEIIKRECLTDDRFKSIQLSRNFRMDGGLTAGLDFIHGDACILMTADLQDPPELIPDFLRMWEAGWENVYGVLTRREGSGVIRNFNSKLFYWILGKLSDGKIPKDASDFRLVDKKVYETVRGMSEKNRFVRGLFAWVGFKSIGVPIERPRRYAGESKAYSFHVLDLALKGIFANTYKPLRVITFIGLILSTISFLSLFPLVVMWVVSGVPFAGFGTLVSLILFVIGALSLMLGIISEYVGLIYEETKGRPNFIVRDSIGIEEKI
jgi:dolichol-phosphate mannosyltransferase